MITLDDILNVTCETIGVDMETVSDKRKINETHQTARNVYCRVAHVNNFGYSEIGWKINRDRRQVYQNIKNGRTDRIFEYVVKEVLANLKNGNK